MKLQKKLAEDYRVVGTVLKNDPLQINITEPTFEKVAMDLTNENDPLQFVASVIQNHGSIDAAVMTVGGFATGAITLSFAA